MVLSEMRRVLLVMSGNREEKPAPLEAKAAMAPRMETPCGW